jgi:hypothetical protein
MRQKLGSAPISGRASSTNLSINFASLINRVAFLHHRAAHEGSAKGLGSRPALDVEQGKALETVGNF